VTERDLDEWDAEIETDFRRAVAAGKKAGQRKRGRKLVAFPLAFSADVCRRTEGRTALVVAMLIYRRTHVCRSQTVTLPASELAMHGIARNRKAEALGMLEAAGLIRIEKTGPGRTVKVTLTWQPK
jgi:hypothetical protein